MRKDKIRAYELRRQGKSYSEMSKTLDIPKSTLSDWFRDEDWSREIRDKLGAIQSLAHPARSAAIIKSNKKRWAEIHQKYRDAAETDFDALKNIPLFLAGLMLYWGEGERGQKGSRVKLANTDPIMIRLFYRMLKEVVRVPPNKIYVWLLLYPDLVDNMQKKFWSRATGIPLSQFKNSIYIKGRHPTKRLSYGVCNVFVSSRELKEKIMTWLDLCQKMLAQ